MIYTERKVSIKNDKATIDSPIILFRGDREVEIMFTIVDSKFKFESNKGNVIDKTQAAFGQLAVALPDGTDLFTEIVRCENGVVVFSITGEMIDEIHEVGFYSFHIRLYNDDKTSRITLPPVMEGIEIREPLIIEADSDEAVSMRVYAKNTSISPIGELTTGEVIDTNVKMFVDKNDMPIYPITHINAVFDNNGESLNRILDTKANTDTVFTMKNMGQDIKEAMTGGSVAVVGKDAVLTENIMDGQVTKEKTDFVTVQPTGKNIYNRENAIIDGMYETTNNIPVDINKGKTISISTKGGHHGYIEKTLLLDSTGVAIEGVTIASKNNGTYSGKVVTLTDDARYLQVRYRIADSSGNTLCDDIMIAYSDSILMYEPYVASVAIEGCDYVTSMECEKIVRANGVVRYVSFNGNDEYDGLSSTTPFKTFNKAIRDGASIIYAERGRYVTTFISASNMESLTILPMDNDEEYTHTAPIRQPIELYNAIDITEWDSNDDILTSSAVDSNQFRACFIDKTVVPVVNESRDSYRVQLWQRTGNSITDRILKPVLSESDLVEGCYTMNETNLLIKPYTDIPYEMFSAVKHDNTVISIQNIKKVHMEDVSVCFGSRSGVSINNCVDVKLFNCQASYSGIDMGFALINVNGEMINCFATKNRFDGFNIHGYGSTNFINCTSVYNYDDGISHHDGCTGYITYGEYSHNGKCGIAPAYGANVNVYNTVCSFNPTGIGYLTTDNGHASMSGICMNNLLTDNNIGLHVGELCKVTNHNNTFYNNTTDEKIDTV